MLVAKVTKASGLVTDAIELDAVGDDFRGETFDRPAGTPTTGALDPKTLDGEFAGRRVGMLLFIAIF